MSESTLPRSRPTPLRKTLLASHAVVSMARDWQASDAPVAVWLVPSDAIRAQTLSALQAPAHPYRAALEEVYGQRLQVCDLERLSTLACDEWQGYYIARPLPVDDFLAWQARQE